MSSIFTNPWMLAAMAAVLIPLIIELLFRLHRRRVDLPTIRWLLKHKDQKKIKRQNRLLIIIRSLVIFFLVLGIMRPIIGKGVLGGVRQRRVIVLLDATTSMGQRAGGTKAFDLARERAETLIRRLSEVGRGTEVAVATFGDDVQPVVAPAEDQDLEAAADAVRGLETPGGSATAGDALQFAVENLSAGDDVDNEVYVFSDFQRRTWLQDASVAPAMKELAGSADVFLVDVADESAFNLLVTQFEPVEPIATVGMPVEFAAAVQGYGSRPAGAGGQEPSVTFLVNRQKKGVRPLPGADAPGETGSQQWTARFKHTFSRPGEYLVEVEITGDQNALDNRRQYLISVPAQQRVLILDPTMPLVGEVDDRRTLKSYYLQEAISPEQPPGYDRVSHFGAEVVNPRNATTINLGAYCAVISAGMTEWPDALMRNCEVYVRDGGALMIFLDEGLNRFDFNQKLVRDGKGLMPVVLSAPVSGGAAGDLVLSLSTAPHPALAVFGQGTSPVRPRVTRYMPLSVQEAAAGEVQVVAAFSNAQPAVLERRFGRGRAVLFNLTPDPRWTDLPALTDFVPLIQEMLRYIVGNPDASANLEVGDAYTTRVLKSSQHLRLICPDRSKERLTPTRAAAGGGWEVRYVPNAPGMYSVDARRGEVPRPRFVVNVPSVEGDPSRLNQGDLPGVIGGVQFDWVPRERSMAKMVARRYSVIEAALMILAVVAALLAMESLLAALFGRRRGLVSVSRLASGQQARTTAAD